MTVEEQKDGPGTAILNDEEIAMYDNAAKGIAAKRSIHKVHPVVLMDPDDKWKRYVAYVSEPNYSTKISILNKSSQLGPWPAADEMREACILKEDSDPITYGESPECDRYKLGVTEYCMGIVSRFQNQFKKK